jgi:hypothetical protein
MTDGGPSQDARECAAEHYGGSACDERSTIITFPPFLLLDCPVQNCTTTVTKIVICGKYD